MFNILVTGAGGTAGVNFIRSITLSDKYFVVGTERNKYHTLFPNVNKMEVIPNHSDHNYLDELRNVIERNDIDFLHPQPTPELQVIAKNRDALDVETYLPATEVVLRDKLAQQRVLERNGIDVTKTIEISSEADLHNIEGKIAFPVWVRAKRGAGGRLSNKCHSINDVLLWIKLCVSQGRAKWDDFIIQEFLEGRDLAWDSLWHKGKLVTSYARERLEYPFSQLTLSGITGTPTVARVIHEDKVNLAAEKAVRAIDLSPHGCYSVDMKEKNGKPMITEVDSGKFHTTIGLWGYAAVKHLKLPATYALPNLYLSIGLEKQVPDMPKYDIYPEIYLVRHIDCGAWITDWHNLKEKVL